MSDCATPGTVCAWGNGSDGELGNGTTTGSSAVPVRVENLDHVTAVAAGSTIFGNGYGHAVRSDGTVRSWGYGNDGQLGDGRDSTNSPVPVRSTIPGQVLGLDHVVSVAAGGGPGTGYALRADGTVWAWGVGSSGQLGNGLDGEAIRSNIPVAVHNLAGVIAISAGVQTGYALRSDGTVWAWGSGYRGALGDGTTGDAPHGDRLVPIKVTNLTNITAIAGGFQNAYALRADGSVWAWGNCNWGALGDASATCNDALVPVQVSGLDNITAIASSSTNVGTAYALRSDGAVWAWGFGYQGQLGNGISGFGSDR